VSIPSSGAAQECLVIFCHGQSGCTFLQAYSPTLNTSDSVRLVPSGSAPEPRAKGRNVRISSLVGLYREPGAGALRVLGASGELGDLVLPARANRGGGPEAVPAPWSVEYGDQPKAKTRVSVSAHQFVAMVRGPRLNRAAVDFVRRETLASQAHPQRSELIAAALVFAGQSEELQHWRANLLQTMRRSLEAVKNESADPARIEAVLTEGHAAIGIFRQVSPDSREDAVLQDLGAEYARLRRRFAIANVLKHSSLHDAFVAKMEQIGLARWSRPELTGAVEQAITASATLHQSRADELIRRKQFAVALDEAEIASRRLPCNDETSDLYYQARVYHVNQNKVPVRLESENDNRSMLEQIVRELQATGQEATLTPEQIAFFRKRIAEGERRGQDYLPLQLKKAEFLASIGELSESRDVVTRIERAVSLGRTEADGWLQMDAILNNKLLTLRQEVERLAKAQIANGDFKDAMATAERGLAAEPDNPRFLYLGAIAASVLRDHEKAKQLVRQYLRQVVAGCENSAEATATMFDLYRRQPQTSANAITPGGTPNWISGETYPAGEVSYDVVSGSFNPRIGSSTIIDDNSTKATSIIWEGYLATRIQTMVNGERPSERHTTFELEPIYEANRVYMSGIGSRAMSNGQRRVIQLRYLNSPAFDPSLAARFTKKTFTRGWSGNPFFHPFVWNDVFMFELEYDELGRLKYATPDTSDPSRPVSAFSERLTFTWEGNTRKLRSITGARYKRELIYDGHGLLIEEKIAHPQGKGWIRYFYKGKPAQLAEIMCEDNFYDKAKRKIFLAQPLR
jgi:hypothetical protein